MIPNFNGGSSAGAVNPEKSEVVKLFKRAGQGNPNEIAKALPLYWGPQPFTAGPMYMGAITVFLFLLALSGWLFLRFATRRGLLSLYLGLFVLGVMSGECALGAVLSIIAVPCLRHVIATSPANLLADDFMWEMHAFWLTLAWLTIAYWRVVSRL